MGRTILFLVINKVYVHMVIWNFNAFCVEGFFDGFTDFKTCLLVFVGDCPDSQNHSNRAAVKILNKDKRFMCFREGLTFGSDIQ